MMTGVEVVHVPYRGTVAALTGVVAGEVHVMFDAITSVLPHVQSGGCTRLQSQAPGVWTPLPDIPTVAETVPGYEVSGVWVSARHEHAG